MTQTSVTTPTLSLVEQARALLAQTQIVYGGQSGDEFAFTVTHDGQSHTAVYHNGERRWRCDCDGFDAAQGSVCTPNWSNSGGRRSLNRSNVRRRRRPMATPAACTQSHRQSAGERSAARHPTAARRRRGARPLGLPDPRLRRDGWSAEIAVALHAPFPAEMVGWKAQATTKDGSRAMAVAYIDARAVADRLDETVGPENWCDGYIVLGEQRTTSGMEIVVACRLTVLGVTKEDVGTGEDYKAAYSDAFKRAGVRHGIGRYLYSLDKQWVAYDAQKKQLKQTPQLPPWAVPN
jgi:hypothetical protein